jgi:hypothetical protein
MTTPLAAFIDLPSKAFPLVVEFFKCTDLGGLKPIHRINISGPGAMDVPALTTNGVPVWVRVTSADGTQHESGRYPCVRKVN